MCQSVINSGYIIIVYLYSHILRNLINFYVKYHIYLYTKLCFMIKQSRTRHLFQKISQRQSCLMQCPTLLVYREIFDFGLYYDTVGSYAEACLLLACTVYGIFWFEKFGILTAKINRILSNLTFILTVRKARRNVHFDKWYGPI